MTHTAELHMAAVGLRDQVGALDANIVAVLPIGDDATPQSMAHMYALIAHDALHKATWYLGHITDASVAAEWPTMPQD